MNGNNHSAKIKERAISKGLVYNSRFLPFHSKLLENVKKLRSNMTEPEKKLWFQYLRLQKVRFSRQHPIDLFIVDFYCPKLHLVIEIDGESHNEQEQIIIDSYRDRVLGDVYGLKILRFSNYDIMHNFDGVCQVIAGLLDNK